MTLEYKFQRLLMSVYRIRRMAQLKGINLCIIEHEAKLALRRCGIQIPR